jgi:signal transduction histidine kinase
MERMMSLSQSSLPNPKEEEIFEPPPLPDRPFPLPVIVFLLVVAMLAFIDRYLGLNTMILECVHALVVSAILLSCLVFERRHPHVRQFGWPSIVWGIGLLMFGTWVDILDDPPLIGGVYGRLQFPFGPSWGWAVLKTTVGYSIGIGLFAYGFFQWLPWMVRTRLEMQKLNKRLSLTNRRLNQAMISLDEHIESERLAISRELHDDVAQQLTFVNVQIQLCRKELDSVQAAYGQPENLSSGENQGISSGCLEKAQQQLDDVATNVSEALKSVRQISGELRPESMFSLGLLPALEQFFEKLHHRTPSTDILLTFEPINPDATQTHFEKKAGDAKLLHLFRIIQEGVRNAIRHASPTEVIVRLEEKRYWDFAGPLPETPPVHLHIFIEDNGPGLPWPVLPPDELLIEQGHLGIVGLKERVRELGGTFNLSARQDQTGTCLEIRL